MKATQVVSRLARLAVVLIGLLVAVPARAEWTPVAEVPTTTIFAVRANGDTVTAGADTAVYISTNAGASWQRSAKPVAGVKSIQTTWVRNGRLYAGTFGQGVRVSDDLGATWQPFNEGLVGGLFNSQLDVVDFELRGDSLFAATAGAGVYVRNLAAAGTWHLFGTVLEPNQASVVNSLELGGSRLIASAGANGQMFFCDPGDVDWTLSNLDNQGLHPGVTAQTSVWTGTGWVVGTNRFLFRSVTGREPWSFSDLGLGPINWTALEADGHHVFAAFDLADRAVMQESDDDGATWQNREDLFGAFVIRMAVSGGHVFAARTDGLWRRESGVASVPLRLTHDLRFALAGPQPFRDRTRLHFELAREGSASIDVFDALGRSTGDRIAGTFSAGAHDVDLRARGLPSGVYTAVLSADGERRAIRLVHLR